MFVRGFSKFRELVAWADIVHYHFPWPFQDIMHASLPKKLRRQKKFIATYHADIIKQKFLLKLYSPLMHWFLGQMDHLVASSVNYSQGSLILRPYLDKVKVIPFGLDESTLPVLNKDNKAEWKNKVGEGFFFFIGVLRYYKGLHILLEAARDQKFKIVIAGAGNQKAVLMEMIKQYSLSNVVLVGRVTDEDKVSLLELSKGVVMPSFLRSEAFGIALLEGLSAGKPLVTADINSGMSFVNKHEETGLWVEPESPISLRVALNQLNEDADLCEELGRNARARFDAEFLHGIMTSRYMSLYQSLLAD
jgi:glycosyltransferase involved in cell wall biosynthesis